MTPNPIRTPRMLRFFSFFMLVFPLFYIVFASFIFELQSKGLLSLALSPLFYLASIFWVISGFGIRRMAHWSWYTFLAAQLFSIYLNALNLVNYSESQTKGWAFAVTLLIQGYVYMVVVRHLRVPYLFPRIKWWESGLAAIPHIPVEVFHVASPTGTSFGQMLDINQRGCFVKSPAEFEPYEKIKIRIDAYGQKLDIPGFVVYHAKSTVTHPKGIGVQFAEVDRTRRRKLRVIARRFEKERDRRNEVAPIPTGPESGPELLSHLNEPEITHQDLTADLPTDAGLKVRIP